MSSQVDIAQAKELAILAGTSLYHYKLIARAVSRDEDTLLLWRKDDKEFSDRLEAARTEFIKKQIGKAKPEFLLERLEKDIFGAKLELDPGESLVKVLLAAYGLTNEGNDATETDAAIQSPSDSQT